jgi:alkylresorcinol/alkylpyrone synthase
MPTIRAVSTALPPYAIPQAAIREAARAHFAPAFPMIDRYLPVFQNARIDTRHFAAPLEWFAEPHSLQQSNDRFLAVATEIGEQAARACLGQVGLAPSDIDHIFWVSTTGLAAPSPDALLINRLGMRRTTRRTPIWGLGCAGGVAGLARAAEYVRAFPTHRALLLSVELCSVTFQWEDRSRRNLIAASLFADGGAAVLVEGDQVGGPHVPQGRPETPPTAGRPPVRVVDTQSMLWPGTPEIMGWDIVDTGMQVVFSARIPGIIASEMRGVVEEFLARHRLTLDDISQWVLHPGGAKVISAYEAALSLAPEQLRHSRDILRRYGNMSSASIFFVLESFLCHQPLQAGTYGLLAVLGPGFSCELALIRGEET